MLCKILPNAYPSQYYYIVGYPANGKNPRPYYLVLGDTDNHTTEYKNQATQFSNSIIANDVEFMSRPPHGHIIRTGKVGRIR